MERSFATSYGRMSEILNEAVINGPLRKSIWAEVANYETYTANILVSRKDEMCPYEKFYGRNPVYVKDLTAFGKICISKRNNDLHRSKLTNKGIPCMMVGYAKDNATGTYRMLNLESNRIIKSRNVRWMNRTYGEYVRGEIDEIEVNQESFTDHSGTDTDDSSTSSNEVAKVKYSSKANDPVSRRTRSKTKLQASLSAMRKQTTGRKIDKSEVAHALMALVGGTDTSQEVPLTFREAWDHHYETERILWREAIRK